MYVQYVRRTKPERRSFESTTQTVSLQTIPGQRIIAVQGMEPGGQEVEWSPAGQAREWIICGQGIEPWRS